MSQSDRIRRLDELRTELSKLKTMISAGGSVENPGRVKALRRTIARLLTVMREEALEV
jgi:large subunit ribosomal protein L29